MCQAQTFTLDSDVTLNNGPLSQGCSWVDINADVDWISMKALRSFQRQRRTSYS